MWKLRQSDQNAALKTGISSGCRIQASKVTVKPPALCDAQVSNLQTSLSPIFNIQGFPFAKQEATAARSRGEKAQLN